MPIAHAAPPTAGSVAVLVVQNGAGAGNLSVKVDGQSVGQTNVDGLAHFDVKTGPHRLVVERDAKIVGFAEFRVDEGEAAEIAITVPTEGVGEPRVESSVFPVEPLQPAKLNGTITDTSGKVVASATITTSDISAQTQTDDQGRFELNLPRGSYDLTVKDSSLGERRFGGIHASPLLGSDLTLVMNPAEVTIQEIVVTSRRYKATPITMERDATAVLDVISMADIALAGDGDAAAALQRVTGVTIQDDFVYVRGLGDRYSATIVNGAELPSPDPTRRVLALDLFPTDLIGDIQVQKTYTPDLPGDFSGGVVRLETRKAPTDFKASIGASIGGNLRSTGQLGYTYKGGDTDFLGIDDGSRDIPDIARNLSGNGLIALNDLSETDRKAVADSLPNVYDKRLLNLPADVGFDLSWGNRFTGFSFGDIGLQFAAVYDNQWRFRREERNRLQSTGQGSVTVQQGSVMERTEQSVDLGALASATLKLENGDQLEYVSLLTRQTQDGVFYDVGYQRYSDTFDYNNTTLEWIEEQLLSQQLLGTHTFESLGDLELKWNATYATAKRDQPDRRDYTYGKPLDAEVTPFLGPGSAPLAVNRSWQFLTEDALDFGLDFTKPIEFTDTIAGKLKFGARTGSRERDFDTVRWSFNVFSLSETQRVLPSVESILKPGNISGLGGSTAPDGKVILVNSTYTAPGIPNSDRYKGDIDQSSGYAMLDTALAETIQLQVGGRYEQYKVGVDTYDLDGNAVGAGGIDSKDWLPAAGLTWSPTSSQRVRFGAAKTVNRPQFRELSPVQFIDPETRFITFGNPNLKQADVLNADLRYEFYWSRNESVSIAAFYKDFDRPIEVVSRPTSGNQPFLTFANAKSATDYGVELDVRSEFDELGDIAGWLGRTYTSFNVSLIETQAKLDPNTVGGSTNLERPLQGQSPWIVNWTLGYRNPSSDTDVTLLFNVYGKRITEAGYDGLPDAKEQPAPMLDLNIRKRLFNALRFNLKLNNLLDPTFEVRQADIAQRKFKRGVSGSLGVEYEF